MVSSETELPYNYYSLPFCKPNEGVRKSINSVNPGTILMGSRVENSPYNFSMLVRSSSVKPTACLSAHPLTCKNRMQLPWTATPGAFNLIRCLYGALPP